MNWPNGKFKRSGPAFEKRFSVKRTATELKSSDLTVIPTPLDVFHSESILVQSLSSLHLLRRHCELLPWESPAAQLPRWPITRLRGPTCPRTCAVAATASLNEDSSGLEGSTAGLGKQNNRVESSICIADPSAG